MLRTLRQATIERDGVMASRAKKKYRYRTEQQHTTLRAGEQPGTQDVQIALMNLPTPAEEFYCNTATMKRRPSAAQLIFGQVHALSTSIGLGLVVEIPYRAMPPLSSTFNVEGFREKVAILAGASGAMPVFPMLTRHADGRLVGAHVARILINDFAGLVDFYEVEPRLGTSQPVNPVIRVKSLPSVVKWFIETVDALAQEVSEGRVLETPDHPSTRND